MNTVYSVARHISVSTVAILLLAGCFSEPTAPANQAPSISSVSVTPEEVIAGETVTVTVSAQDPEGDALVYAYSVNGGAVNGSGSSVSWTSPSSEGAFSITATVTDAPGLRATASATLMVLPAPTEIRGTVELEVGQSGDLSNALVSLYADLNDFANNLPMKTDGAEGSGGTAAFVFDSLPEGTYYLSVWKDNDNSASVNDGDFYGWYGSEVYPDGSLTPVTVAKGQVQTITVTAVEVQPVLAEIGGTVELEAGQAGDLSGATVSLYANVADFNNGLPTVMMSAQGTGRQVSFVFDNLPDGTYLLSVWKDNDASATLSDGDFYGWHGSAVYPAGNLTPITVVEGEVETISVTAIEVVVSPTQVDGTATLLSQFSGDLAGATVYLFDSEDGYRNGAPYATMTAVGSGTRASYLFGDLPAGRYLLTLWKDMNQSQNIDPGDLYGYHGDVYEAVLYWIDVAEDQAVTADSDVFIVSEGILGKAHPAVR